MENGKVKHLHARSRNAISLGEYFPDEKCKKIVDVDAKPESEGARFFCSEYYKKAISFSGM